MEKLVEIQRKIIFAVSSSFILFIPTVIFIPPFYFKQRINFHSSPSDYTVATCFKYMKRSRVA
jgi:hypothetical protein